MFSFNRNKQATFSLEPLSEKSRKNATMKASTAASSKSTNTHCLFEIVARKSRSQNTLNFLISEARLNWISGSWVLKNCFIATGNFWARYTSFQASGEIRR